nr:restriction endonuclease subunit S [uncultured Ruminococcus sp.]
MDKEVKQRLEKLNNGEIPKGYKKTDFGVFPSDWVTDKKLIDIGTFGKGKGIPGNKMQSDGVPCVGYGDIYMKYNHFHFEEAQSFVDEETAKDSQLIKKGTLLFTGTGETAEEIGKCVCYNGYSTIYAGGDIITFVPQDVNPLFLAYQQYQNFSLKKKASFGQGHSVVHIQKESLEKLNVAYPESKNEQSRIVEILMKWDEAIELYDKQIDALTRYKAVCLRKMFPAKDQNVPEWRFRGFSGDWKQRKVAEMFKITRGYVLAAPLTDENPSDAKPYPVYSSQTKDNGLMGYYKDYLYEDAITWTTDGANAGTVNYRGGKFYCTNVCGVLLADKVTPNQMIAEALNNVAKGHVSYVGNPKLMNNVMAEITISLPTSEKEREAISAFFDQIDNLITLHQRKKMTIINQRKALQKYLLNGIVRVNHE